MGEVARRRVSLPNWVMSQSMREWIQAWESGSMGDLGVEKGQRGLGVCSVG